MFNYHYLQIFSFKANLNKSELSPCDLKLNNKKFEIDNSKLQLKFNLKYATRNEIEV